MSADHVTNDVIWDQQGLVDQQLHLILVDACGAKRLLAKANPPCVAV